MIADPETPEKIPFDLASFDAVVFSDVEKRRHRAARKLQIFAGVVVVVAHVAFWWLLQWLSRPDMPRPRDRNSARATDLRSELTDIMRKLGNH